jgi:hypothetical protein
MTDMETNILGGGYATPCGKTGSKTGNQSPLESSS